MEYVNETSNNLIIERTLIREISEMNYTIHICPSSDVENLFRMDRTRSTTIYDSIEDSLNIPISKIRKLENGANCAGHTTVYISLARSLGIPVREVTMDAGFYGIHLPHHEFVEIYNGTDWIPVDPTNNFYGWQDFEKPLNITPIYNVIAYDVSGNSIDRTDVYRYNGKL